MSDIAVPKRGRPFSLTDGKRVTLTLDAATIAKAKALGAGNVSRGVREAVLQVSSGLDPKPAHEAV